MITTDQTADYPEVLLAPGFKIMPMSYVIDNVIYDNVETPFLSSHDFYEKIAEGKSPRTTMITEEEAYDFFKEILLQDLDILHISFSSALSGCYTSYIKAANRLKKEFPKKKILIVDSLCASIGEALLCYYSILKREEGASIEENEAYINDLKFHIAHSFKVSDMHQLYVGGRISRSTKVIGSTLHIQPILTVSDKGELVKTNNTIGKRNAIKTLVEKMKINTKGYDNKVVIIGHSDCIDEANTLKTLVEKELNITNIVITDIGPIIGTHCGKGMLALVYLTDSRIPKVK